jgi:predicted CoA-binding protein
MPNELDTLLRRVLAECRSIAVVGLSAQPHRPSHGVALYMLAQGYRIIPVNPAYTEVLGQRCHASLAEVPEPVHMVNVFRRTDEVLPVAHQAIAIGARCLWQQLGVVNEAADQLVRQAGLDAVMDRCVKIEHARLLGRT